MTQCESSILRRVNSRQASTFIMDEQEITRMVSFRLRVDQYTTLEELRSAQGARSVSDLFRQAVEKLIQDFTTKTASKDALSLRVRKLEKKLDSLAVDVEKLKTVGVR
jgi:hypothetical protein